MNYQELSRTFNDIIGDITPDDNICGNCSGKLSSRLENGSLICPVCFTSKRDDSSYVRPLKTTNYCGPEIPNSSVVFDGVSFNKSSSHKTNYKGGGALPKSVKSKANRSNIPHNVKKLASDIRLIRSLCDRLSLGIDTFRVAEDIHRKIKNHMRVRGDKLVSIILHEIQLACLVTKNILFEHELRSIIFEKYIGINKNESTVNKGHKTHKKIRKYICEGKSILIQLLSKLSLRRYLSIINISTFVLTRYYLELITRKINLPERVASYSMDLYFALYARNIEISGEAISIATSCIKFYIRYIEPDLEIDNNLLTKETEKTATTILTYTKYLLNDDTYQLARRRYWTFVNSYISIVETPNEMNIFNIYNGYINFIKEVETKKYLKKNIPSLNTFKTILKFIFPPENIDDEKNTMLNIKIDEYGKFDVLKQTSKEIVHKHRKKSKHI